ncbi:MAG: hypothetical protein JG782_1956, partial [Anaerophaga sp.]|nr:hypothetical protein [Anaerophaga sp.]
SDGHREYLLTGPSGKTHKLRTIEDLLARIDHEEASFLTD